MMPNTDVVPELKQIIGAMIFGANRALSVKEMRKCLQEVAQLEAGETAAFGKVTEADIRAALEALGNDVKASCCGFHIGEVAGGTRFHSDVSCGKWLRHLLNAGKPNRLSRPALETLAIIAYRQPTTRADIEAVRGVTVDHIIKSLMEMQLIKIVGRSELAGRPFQYGTTHVFLEHFGLTSLDELNNMEPLLLAAREEQVRKQKAKESEAPKTGVECVVAEGQAEAVGEAKAADEAVKDEGGKGKAGRKKAVKAVDVISEPATASEDVSKKDDEEIVPAPEVEEDEDEEDEVEEDDEDEFDDDDDDEDDEEDDDEEK